MRFLLLSPWHGRARPCSFTSGVILVSLEDWWSGTLRRLDLRQKNEIHQSIVQYIHHVSRMLVPAWVLGWLPGSFNRVWPACVVDDALSPALNGVAELVPARSRLHVWLVYLVSWNDWRSGALRRLDNQQNEWGLSMHCTLYTQVAVQVAGPCLCSRVVPGRHQQGLVDAGTLATPSIWLCWGG